MMLRQHLEGTWYNTDNAYSLTVKSSLRTIMKLII